MSSVEEGEDGACGCVPVDTLNSIFGKKKKMGV
jgi:hypothetical protein